MRDRIKTLDHGACWVAFDGSRTSDEFPWIRRFLGDEAISAVVLPLETDLEERRQLKHVFPEARISWAIASFNGSDALSDFPDDR